MIVRVVRPAPEILVVAVIRVVALIMLANQLLSVPAEEWKSDTPPVGATNPAVTELPIVRTPETTVFTTVVVVLTMAATMVTTARAMTARTIITNRAEYFI